MDYVIEVKEVTKIYKALDFWKNDRVIAIENIGLNVKKGEVFGLLGLNGAGKTTLMKIMLGLLRPDRGAVRILGGSIESTAVRAKIGYLSELPYFPQYLKVREVLDYFAELFAIPASAKSARIEDVLNTVRLIDKADTKVKGLSKGMQGRLGLAQAILNDPDVLFMDEPMSGLDPLGYKETRDIIIDLNRRGKTIFFNSHILSEVEKLCDRVAVLHKGRLIDIRPTGQIMKKHKSMENYFVKTIMAEEKK
jgi:ABC-2 type transport system ATP-binding protein